MDPLKELRFPKIRNDTYIAVVLDAFPARALPFSVGKDGRRIRVHVNPCGRHVSLVGKGKAFSESRWDRWLGKEGFGVLTEIDVKATLKKKLDVDFRPYVILGACNPPMAHRALSAETAIGLLLPCNVVVYAGDEPGTSVVAVLDAEVQLGVTGRDDLKPIAAEVKSRLGRALNAVKAKEGR